MRVVMVVGTFIGSRLTKKFVNLHTAFIIVSTSITISLQLADAIVLKAQPLDTLPLFQVSCQLWSETNSFEYKTICISHVPQLPLHSQLIHSNGHSISLLSDSFWISSSCLQSGLSTGVTKLNMPSANPENPLQRVSAK